MTGGEIPREDGFFYAPTILDGVADDDAIACQEVFGPVATVHEFETEAEVTRRSNDSNYGLYAAAVWSESIDRVHRLARRLEAGTVAINIFPATSNRAPFGGYKESGIGRVNGQQAMMAYTELKNVVLNVDADELQ